MSDGEFLVRESSKKPGQYVLTGMADSKIQHLLLMDKQGKVSGSLNRYIIHRVQTFYYIMNNLMGVVKLTFH